VDPLFLTGQHEATMDPKNRILVPAALRRFIRPESHGKDFFLIMGDGLRPWLYPDRFYANLAGSLGSDVAPGPASARFDRVMFGLAQFVELDAQGRILVPVGSLEWTGLQENKAVYLVGARDHIELWPKADWETERKALAAQRAEIVAAHRQADRSIKPPLASRGDGLIEEG